MPGMAEGIPGAKAFDEMYEQTQAVNFRNQNKGQPPDKKIILEPESTKDFKRSVLKALGVGKIVTFQG